ncbi:Inward Rectifying K (potassium) channel family [Brachionus plicatilis]|uniref:Inward Rectifying K (Potassium) channel family n=1 Tax=Brachionus plicatilis TaxID=10195 RepID=A0A3M7PW97_BRAPC|nr:Inward Rectifying K (potassium) channel family [Brachionus plicatilis]
MLLNNLYIFGKRRAENQTSSFESHHKEFYNGMTETNILLDQTDACSKISKTRFNNGVFDNSLTRRKLTETYFQGLEHNKRPRLVKKCGELNIHMDNVPKHKRRLLSDMFNTILDMKWRWHLVIFFLSFIISWFFFATIWYMIGKLERHSERNINKRHLYKRKTLLIEYLTH